MILRPLALASLLFAPAAFALTFQTRLERVEWHVDGDKFECRLSQAVAGLGAGEFVRRAGEEPVFRLRAREHGFAEGSATLLAAASPWRPTMSDISLGQVPVRHGDVVLDSNHYQAGRLLRGLLEGRSTVVRHRSRHGGERLEVRLLPARFAKAYDEYLACTAKLLPVNFDQIRNTRIPFPSANTDLDDKGKARLDIILDFIGHDPSINRIYLDGHSDNAGDRLLNRELSRRRALAVKDYLVAKGFPEDQITLRFHGERYPLMTNNSAANRAKNRRVEVRLEREPVLEASAVGLTDQPAGTPL